jgi:hypothetical protein
MDKLDPLDRLDELDSVQMSNESNSSNLSNGSMSNYRARKPWLEMFSYGKFTNMNQKAKKKLCWNCEGSVSLAEETCPFCGVTVVPAFLEGAAVEFAPPYATRVENEFDIPKSPYGFDEEKQPAQQQKEPQEALSMQDEFKRTALSVTFLLCGSVFFLFSLALGLFSHNGIFTLQWNAEYWFIYTGLALPLFFVGWRFLMKLDA